MTNIRFLLFGAISLFTISLFSSCKCEAQHINKGTIKQLEYSTDTLKINLSAYYRKGCYIINRKIDLKGKTLYLPPNVTIQMKGGMFKNGIIKGNNTTLKYVSNSAIFDCVHIKGTWRVPNISTSMFTKLDYENSLKDVFALANPVVNNRIYIESGLYILTAYKNDDQCIKIVSNTDVVIDGTIKLSPNVFTHYSMISIKGNNIRLSGKGVVAGDKDKHLGKKGEWGMGIYISEGSKVYVSGLTVKDCWGDCIYITGESKDVIVDGCFLNNGRRQGISIISAKNVLVKNCIISNVKGKAPQYAIDIEPNVGNRVCYVCIENVKVIDCKGGFMCNGKAQGAEVGNLVVKDCIIESAELFPLYFETAKNVAIEYNKIINSNAERMIVVENVDSVNVVNNTISGSVMDVPLKKTITINNKAKFKTFKNNIVY